MDAVWDFHAEAHAGYAEGVISLLADNLDEAASPAPAASLVSILIPPLPNPLPSGGEGAVVLDGHYLITRKINQTTAVGSSAAFSKEAGETPFSK